MGPPIRGFKVLSTAINNGGVAKLASVMPDRPVFFLKAASTLIGHGEPIVIRPDYGCTHPEAELAVVIVHARSISRLRTRSTKCLAI